MSRFLKHLNDSVDETNEYMNKNANIDLPPIPNNTTPIPPGVKEPIFIPEEKKSKVGIGAGSVIGALTGALVAGVTTKQLKKFTNNNIPLPTVMIDDNKGESKRYYDDAKSLINNLRIVFTPLGVTCTIKDKKSHITVENIEISEMTREMYSAWQNRDSEYFKALIMSKMYSELQMAEKLFVKRFLDKHSQFQKEIVKKANMDDFSSTDYYEDDMCDVELFKAAQYIHSLFDSDTYKEVGEKIASSICDDLSDEFIGLDLSLERPFSDIVMGEKLAGFFSLTNKEDVNNLNKKMTNKSYLKNNMKMSYMPDRILFSVDGILIGTLGVMDMNTEGFNNFKSKNSNYFKKFFIDNIKQGLAKINGRLPADNDFVQEKTASASDVSVIFDRTDIHPVVYYLVLTNKLGQEWFDYEPMALIKIIEKEYGVEEVGAVAQNKIFSIQVANNSSSVFDNHHAFEKVLRSFTEKPVDFFERQTSDINIGDVAFCIDVLDRVTPDDDVYSVLSPDVYSYIVKLLAQHEIYAFLPTFIIGSPNEAAFNALINYSLLGAINKDMASTMNRDIESRKEMEDNNEIIYSTAKSIIPVVKNQFKSRNIPKDKLRKFTTELMDKANIKSDLRQIIYNQVLQNIALDDFLVRKEDILKEQLDFFEIKGGETING